MILMIFIGGETKNRQTAKVKLHCINVLYGTYIQTDRAPIQLDWWW